VKVFIIRKAGNHPQLIAVSRHLTGAFSIEEINWDMNKKTLSGTSKTIPGDQYTIYIYLPEGYQPGEINVDAENIIQQVHADGLFEVGFRGKEEAVKWEIAFVL